MPDQDLPDFIVAVISDMRERGLDAVQMWKRSVQAGHGGDLMIRVPLGPRILPEAGFRSEGYPS